MKPKLQDIVIWIILVANMLVMFWLWNSSQPWNADIILIFGTFFCVILFLVLRNSFATRREAEEIAEKSTLALSKSESLLKNIIDNTESVIYVKDIEGRYIMVNKQFEALFDTTSSAVKGTRDADIFPKNIADAFMENDRRVLETGEPLLIEEVAPKNYVLHTYISSKFPLRDASGKVYAIAGISTDITERKDIVEAVREGETRLRAVLDNVIDGIITIDQKGMVQSLNLAAEKIFGYASDEVIGKNVKMLMPEPYYEEHDGYLQNYMSTRQAKVIGIGREVMGRRKDGRVFPMDLAVSGMEIDGQQQFVGIVRDITEHKQKDFELQKFKAIIDSSEDAIISKTLKGIITSWNYGAERIFGYTAKEAIGNPMSMLIPTGRLAEEQDILARLARGEKVDHFETVRCTKNGRLIDISATISPILDDNGKVIGASKIARDITERKRGEEELQLAKEAAESANQAKSIFLANMSHEIRTPMNAILGYAQILQRDGSMSQRQRESVAVIEKSGNHLLALINDILDLSKIEAGQMQLNPEDFDLIELIDTVSLMFESRCGQKQLEWQFDKPDEKHIFLHGDEVKLRQVLINLLGNAIKFTDSGKVHFRVTREGADADGEMFRFEVVDTGKGIPLEAQSDIFSPFQQGDEGIKKGGTGLGLFISQKQVHLMGGKLGLTSQLGKGSCFFFMVKLPHAVGEVVSQGQSYARVARLAPNCKVKALVVDDNPVNRDVLSHIFIDVGIEVDMAENGLEAVEKVRRFVPDIVFMDMRMPVMDASRPSKPYRKNTEEIDSRWSLLPLQCWIISGISFSI